MANEEDEKFSLKDRKLGKVKKIIKGSGMLELVNGQKIPPFPDVVVGDEIELKDKRYYIVGKGSIGNGSADNDIDESDDIEALKKENKSLRAKQKKQDDRLKALENLGEKGSAIKGDTGGTENGE